ncbi:methionine-R-sulfoxide reductase B1-A-like [Solea senegalensis]|uniref:Methionine-R-sulfoxide reductase B1-A-like n=2 Tax=Solea senegalensis TaxID=28829 RepID=A0AAV6RJE2_SOLSE|nr:methionine-R-sulfoxide reductase B1-A-like [Solea senegalensis]
MSFCSFSRGEVFKNHFKPGIYVCAKCENQLFSSHSKYEHSSPWPAFTETVHEDSVSKHKERPNAYKVRCGKCENGLGHEFVNDGPGKGLSRF